MRPRPRVPGRKSPRVKTDTRTGVNEARGVVPKKLTMDPKKDAFQFRGRAAKSLMYRKDDDDGGGGPFPDVSETKEEFLG